MDWSLLIFILVVLYFGYRGYRNGLLRSIGRVLSLIAGYLAAILYTGELSPLVESHFGPQGLIALISASLMLFVGAGAAVSFVFRIIEKLLFDDESPSTASTLGGAVLGSLVGLVFAIVIVWAFAFGRDMHLARSGTQPAEAPPSQVETLAGKVAGAALNKALSLGPAEPEVARLGAALLESPAEIAHHSQRLMESQDLQVLLKDPASQRVLDSGDHAAVARLPAFKAFARNPDLQALAKSAGLADHGAESMETRLAMQLTDIWGRSQRVKNDARVREIIDDPGFQQQILSGNPIDLLGNNDLLELADIIFSDEAAPANPSPGGVSEDETPKQETRIYSWTDSSGRTYYSDQKPDSQN